MFSPFFQGEAGIARRGGLDGIYVVRHGDCTVERDSDALIGITLTLSAVHRVRGRSAGKHWNECPPMGSVSILAPGDSARLAITGAAQVMRLELPVAAAAAWSEEDFGIDSARFDLRSAFHVDDPRMLRLLMDAMVGSDEGGGRAIAAHLLSRYGAGRPPPRASGGIAPARLRRLRDMVEEAAPEDLDLARLAAHAGMSPFHFSREFKRAVGEAPMRYVGRRVALRALAPLAESGAPVGEIARRMGYAHASHLARHLRGAVGLNPSHCRALLRA